MALNQSPDAAESPQIDRIYLLDVAVVLAESYRLIVLLPLLAGVIAYGLTYLVSPIFTAKTVILPPQQQQSAGAAMLQSLGGLAGLAGVATGIKSPADQYVSLMQSNTVLDRIIGKHALREVYEKKTAHGTREALKERLRINVGKKDGLITVEVDDVDPKRSAAMANDFVTELRQFTSELAVTEAQQRRMFFEQQLQATRERLTQAQQALQSSGINQGAIRAEPRAAAEAYAAIRAQVTAAEVRLQIMRGNLTEDAPEFKQALRNLQALRAELQKAETADSGAASGDYIGKYRDFKYQESLFELFAKQFELAKLDESRDGAIVQVVDAAMPPEQKSRPQRALIAVLATLGFGFGVLLFVAVRQILRSAARLPENAAKMARLRKAWR